MNRTLPSRCPAAELSRRRVRRGFVRRFLSALSTGLLFVGAAVASSSSMAAEAANCVVVCQVANCIGPDAPPIPPRVKTPLGNCGQKQAVHLPVYGLYQTARGPQRFTINEIGRPFAALVPQLATATCLVGGACLEERDASRRSSKGGMPADEDNSVRQGRPCEAGLPCGQVLLPKDRLLIEVPSMLTGTFTLKTKRGGGVAAMTFPVRDGRIEIPATSLVPAAVYTYTLVGAGGQPVNGEFAVLATKMQKDVEQAIDAVRRADPDNATLDEIEILVEEKLQWDATQRLQ